jgi:hypothetical protein
MRTPAHRCRTARTTSVAAPRTAPTTVRGGAILARGSNVCVWAHDDSDGFSGSGGPQRDDRTQPPPAPGHRSLRQATGRLQPVRRRRSPRCDRDLNAAATTSAPSVRPRGAVISTKPSTSPQPDKPRTATGLAASPDQDMSRGMGGHPARLSGRSVRGRAARCRQWWGSGPVIADRGSVRGAGAGPRARRRRRRDRIRRCADSSARDRPRPNACRGRPAAPAPRAGRVPCRGSDLVRSRQFDGATGRDVGGELTERGGVGRTQRCQAATQRGSDLSGRPWWLRARARSGGGVAASLLLHLPRRWSGRISGRRGRAARAQRVTGGVVVADVVAVVVVFRSVCSCEPSSRMSNFCSGTIARRRSYPPRHAGNVSGHAAGGEQVLAGHGLPARLDALGRRRRPISGPRRAKIRQQRGDWRRSRPTAGGADTAGQQRSGFWNGARMSNGLAAPSQGGCATVAVQPQGDAA